MKTIRNCLVAVIVAIPAAAYAQAEQTTDFTWGDRIDAGRSVIASNINGTVTMRPGSGDRVEVRATKHWRRGDPSLVRVYAEKQNGNVRICPLYRDQQICDDDHTSSHDRRDYDGDVTIDFVILVPKGVNVSASTVNGNVSISGGTENVEAATVNGGIAVESGRGRLSATTVAGGIAATVEMVPQSMNFTSVNGEILVEMAKSIGADVDVTTVNGSVKTDYDIVVNGGWFSNRVSGHIGPSGGPRMHITTVNGGVQLRKR
jgi:hypothetical protein